jgi:hypothetical protein
MLTRDKNFYVAEKAEFWINFHKLCTQTYPYHDFLFILIQSNKTFFYDDNWMKSMKFVVINESSNKSKSENISLDVALDFVGKEVKF